MKITVNQLIEKLQEYAKDGHAKEQVRIQWCGCCYVQLYIDTGDDKTDIVLIDGEE